MSEWISVKDRLPKERELIDSNLLICLSSLSVGIGTFFLSNGELKRIRFNGVNIDVDCLEFKPTHWMLIPEPPKGDEE